MARAKLLVLASASLMASLGAGCSDDPRYLDPAEPLEGGLTDMMGEPLRAAASLTLPIELETAEDAAERAALATELGVEVPYVRLGDLEVAVEWSLENLDNRPGKVRVSLNAGNEYFFYDPSMITLGEGDEESPEPPSLLGNIPMDVPAMGTISGVFREDQVAEMSFDLDQITRGNVNPFRAVLQIDEDAKQFQPLTPAPTMDTGEMQMPMGPPIPREAVAQAIRMDISFESNVHAMLYYNVRVRDLRGILHKYLMAAPVTGVTQFMPALYMPSPAAP